MSPDDHNEHREKAKNPYAPPTTDEPVDGRPRGSLALRVSAGLLLVLVGLWSVLGGSCAAAGGHLARNARQMAEQFDLRGGDEAQQELDAALDTLAAQAKWLIVSGAVIAVGGVLCLVAGILFFLGRARTLAPVGCGVALLGELSFWVLVSFNWAGLIKLPIYGFAIFAARQVGRGQDDA
jgi:hypothetical protein